VITHPESALSRERDHEGRALCVLRERRRRDGAAHRGTSRDDGSLPRGSTRRASSRRTSRRGSRAAPARRGRRRDDKRDEPVHYPLVNDARALLWVANQELITPHVWASRVPDLVAPTVRLGSRSVARGPTRCAPPPSPCARSSTSSRCRSFVKTFGLEGLPHPRPLDGRRLRDRRRFAHGAGAVLVKRPPELLTRSHQGRPRRAHLRRHGPQRPRRHLRRRLCRPAP